MKSNSKLIALYQRKIKNQELSLKEFSDKKLILKSRPSKVLIELTQNCNFKCKMCQQTHYPQYKKYNPKFNMKLEIFENVATSLFQDAYFVDLRGFGETVILPYWPELVEGLDRFPLINWHLVTNLSLPRDETWEKMMEHGFILGISFDAATKNTFETIRVGARFEKIMHNLELVTQSAKQFNRGFIYFIVTVQDKNIGELPDILTIAAKFNVSSVEFKAVTGPFHEENIRDFDLLQKKIDESFDRAIDLNVRLTVNNDLLLKGIDPKKVSKAGKIPTAPANLNFPLADASELKTTGSWTTLDADIKDRSKVSVHQKCFKPYHYTYIGSDGTVGTCNHMMNPEIFEMGDLNQEPFEKIWNNEKFQFFRKILLSAKPIDERCLWCFQHRLED